MLELVSKSHDIRVERYCAIWDKITKSREQWVEGTLELAVFMREARIDYPDHTAFSHWLARNALQKISKDNRTALLWIADNQAEARELLTHTTFKSWDTIYRTRPNRALRVSPKGTDSIKRGHLSGSSGRKRALRIPTVMQHGDEPAPKPVRRSEPRQTRSFTPPPGLTREQVDPDFKGTTLEFATEYGHVNLHTKAEIEHNKRQEALTALLGAIADHERSGREMLALLAAIDPSILHEWLSKPGKAAKLQAWCKSIELACEKLRDISKK